MQGRGWFGAMLAWLAGLVTLAGALFVATEALGQVKPSAGFEAALGSSEPVDGGVVVSARAKAERVRPGDIAVVAVVLDHQEGYHTWPSSDQDVLPPEIAEFAIRTSVSIEGDSPAWLASMGPVQWPMPKPAKVPSATGEGSVMVPTYAGRAIAYVPVRIAADATPGPVTLKLMVGYQACDEVQCLMPQDVPVEVLLVIDPAAAPTVAGGEGDFSALLEATLTGVRAGAVSAGASVSPGATAPNAEERTFLGFITVRGSGIVVLLLAALGGFVLNLTPCVLPVIPLKILTISQHAKTPGQSMYLGLWMAAGVVAFWAGIGVPAAMVSGWADPSRVFGIWWVTVGIGLIIGIMALGLMGLFSISLPQKLYMIDPKADSAGGSFLFGVMTAVLGLPCFGFVVGALLPAAASAQPWQVIGVFTAIGVGMALPYLVLAARPGLLKKVPKAGPASDLVKQVMGLLLLAAAAFFVGTGLIALVSEEPYMGKTLHWWAVAFFAVVAGALLVIRTVKITRKPVNRLLATVFGVAFAAAGILTASGQTQQARSNYEATLASEEVSRDPSVYVTGAWNRFTPELVAKARADGKTVVMDFTADWCLTCKFLKATVLNRDPVKPRLKAQDVVAVTVDLTSKKATGWAKLRELGFTGIPLLVVEGPGLARPWTSNAYTPEQVLQALDAAGGAARAGDPGGESGSRASKG